MSQPAEADHGPASIPEGRFGIADLDPDSTEATSPLRRALAAATRNLTPTEEKDT
ncbi:hypothetical protein [Streptomyces sp. NPDC058084]|uniref:hypothetical protein n=1 Tax=Streptomyces sp. NPDC058084 TaxID=3346333 RepID=UPI0036E13626